MAKKLNIGEQHCIRLIAKGQKQGGGWAKVSKTLYPLVQTLPLELIEHEPEEEGRGRVRLTAAGEAILDAMDWL